VSVIVDTKQQLEVLIGRDVLVYPIPEDDRTHPSNTEIIAFALMDIVSKLTYIVSVRHPEALYHIDSLDFLTGKTYGTNTALLRANGYSVDVDVEMSYYLTHNKGYTLDADPMIRHYGRQFPQCTKTNALIDLYKLEDRVAQVYYKYFSEEAPHGLDFYSSKIKDTFMGIEVNGLKVDVDKFNRSFGSTFSLRDGFSYTQYNYYTTTGRPSNRFDGVNFAALPKDDSTRECFVSRFGCEGSLLELDFNSYHPRIIASIIGYDFKDENVYEHLAKHYHNTSTPTEEQIGTAKEDTFRQIYGGIRRDYLNIPFFAMIDSFVNTLWNHMNKHKYIDSPLSGRRLYLKNFTELSPFTLFNYFIQMTETEYNTNILIKLNNNITLNKLKALPIMYTYDSVLFDIPNNEIDVLIDKVLPASIDLYKFPIKIKSGKDYSNLVVTKKR
tara:strand:+ start:469 stop:1788 length:1320 start_codon:yes stop_codon:yes gene_type:complete